ncbi:MAG: MgtC/SapB family protein [Candidatus Magasanikbacteria bacterium]|nr:MgtC/SapB family protein [Candidatus Magasanikbacteria bacterium]
MQYLIFAGQILLAVLLGGLIGVQRVRSGKSAGPRTCALVASGAALYTLLSANAFGVAEPGRVAAQIITGIGFLGAGVIIHKQGGVVEGLTTAAALWAVAAVGMAVGVGWIWQSFIAAIVMLLVLMINDDFFKKK